jgi:hypothetical protein
MNPFRMTGTTPDGRVGTVWGCGTCLHVCIDEGHASRCCVCSYCKQPITGEEVGKRQTYHKACMDAASVKRHQDRQDKAEKLETWDDGVFWNDDFYPSLEEAVEAIDDQCEDDDRPDWLYVAKQYPMRKLDAEDILQNHFEDLEDGCDYLKGEKEFEAACEAFNEANKDILWCEEDGTRAVRVPKAERGPD